MIVSVIIPLYNKEKYIKRAIDSVLCQTYPAHEIIIVNDGSSDNGLQIAASYKGNNIHLIDQPNSGVSSARNRGISESSGDMIAFLDADDEWMPEHLSTIFKLSQKFPSAGIYATAYKTKSDRGKVYLPKTNRIPPPPWEGIIPDYFEVASLGAPPVCSSTACIPKKVFQEVGNFAVGKRMGEDIDMWGRIALKFPVAFSWEVGATYYQNTNNSACGTFTDDDIHPFIETASRLIDNPIVTLRSSNINAYIDRLRIENAKQFVLIGQYSKARLLVRNCSVIGFDIKKLLWGSHLNVITHIMWKIKKTYK